MKTQQNDPDMKLPADDDVAPYGYWVYEDMDDGGRFQIFCSTPEQVRKLLAERPVRRWEHREDPMTKLR